MTKKNQVRQILHHCTRALSEGKGGGSKKNVASRRVVVPRSYLRTEHEQYFSPPSSRPHTFTRISTRRWNEPSPLPSLFRHRVAELSRQSSPCNRFSFVNAARTFFVVPLHRLVRCVLGGRVFFRFLCCSPLFDSPF